MRSHSRNVPPSPLPRTRAGRRLAALAIVFACAVLTLPTSVPGRNEQRPDVLLLTIDTLRPDYLSVNGYDRPTSPNLDALIRSGWYFEEAASPISHTTPALASLFTGSYPHSTGVVRLWDNLPAEITTLTQVLQDSGWDTFAVVTNQVLTKRRGLDRGFRTYDFSKNSRKARATTDDALRALKDAPRDRPYFAWVHYIDPHTPYRPDSSVAREFDPAYAGPYADAFVWAEPDPLGRRPKSDARANLLPKAEAMFRNPLPPEVLAHIRRLYAAEIRTADNEVGRLIDAFRARSGGRLLIIFTADHGESLGEHDYYFSHGDFAYEATLRVPLAFVLPAGHPKAGHGTLPGRVSLVDLAPTILDILGVDAPPGFQSRIEGQSLVPAFGNEAAPRPIFGESGHAQYPEEIKRRARLDDTGRFRCVALDGWKLIWTPFQTGALEWELYDLAHDPHETRDLWKRDDPKFVTLEGELRAWMQRGAGPAAESEMSPEDLEALRSLGYVR